HYRETHPSRGTPACLTGCNERWAHARRCRKERPMRTRVPTLMILVGTGTLALAACSANEVEPAASPPHAAGSRTTPSTLPAAGGVMRSGDSFAMMSEQYTARAGPYAATGASAGVPPAPAPAFVASGPPPSADPPAPP